MLGIGVAERTGLFPALLKLLVRVTPDRALSPVVVFIGVMSSAASDAGYLCLLNTTDAAAQLSGGTVGG